MKKFKTYLDEMAQPLEKHRGMTFYHGTSDEETGKKILADGKIKPREGPQGKSHLAPVQGKTYITPHKHYAQIYAQGGDVAGSEHHRIKGEHGYVFGVSGKHLHDIQPDEDSVGEQLHQHYRAKKQSRLTELAAKHLTPNTIHKVKSGEYTAWARAGKKLVKHMSDSDKHEAIDNGAHIAHHGELPITHAWRIHKDKVKLLKRDGSNFMDHAEKVL
jgi:hypothetical protein